jgi:riboflavin transporter FmnP
VLVWIAVPPLILLVPLYVQMVNLGLFDTYWSVNLIYTAVKLPFNTYGGAATGVRTIIEERLGPVTRPRSRDDA